MRKFLMVLAVFILGAVAVGPAMADDNPYLGTWKLNTAKSKSEPVPVPKSLTREVTAEGTMVKYSFTGTAADGTAVAYSFTVAYDGKDYPVSGNGMPGGADTISIKRTGNSATAILKKGGKEVATSHSEVSKDGKTTTLKSKGKTADGKAMVSEMVFEKQ